MANFFLFSPEHPETEKEGFVFSLLFCRGGWCQINRHIALPKLCEDMSNYEKGEGFRRGSVLYLCEGMVYRKERVNEDGTTMYLVCQVRK